MHSPKADCGVKDMSNEEWQVDAGRVGRCNIVSEHSVCNRLTDFDFARNG